MSLFEAQDASDIVSQAATSDVNIIFGTSINESLGDEVVVTVIATGIDDDKKTQPARRNLNSQTNAGRANAGRNFDTQRANESEANSAAPSTPRTAGNKQRNDDPFGNWDIRQEPSQRKNPENNDNFTKTEKPDFDIFRRTDTDNSDDNDGGLDKPPFFRRRRN